MQLVIANYKIMDLLKDQIIKMELVTMSTIILIILVVSP
ncbi:hypothetical protein CLU82_0234 [Flavobacterium sp. 5]|nr:hypothetical protein CLU82_0234 [Flavobacterium sp. 5]